MRTKQCRRCKETKDVLLFGSNTSQKDRLHWNCRACAKVAAKESRERKKAKALQTATQHQEERLNQEHLTDSQRSIAKEILKGKPKELEQLSMDFKPITIKNRDGETIEASICAKGHAYPLNKDRKICPSCNQPFVREALIPYKNPRTKVF